MASSQILRREEHRLLGLFLPRGAARIAWRGEGIAQQNIGARLFPCHSKP